MINIGMLLFFDFQLFAYEKMNWQKLVGLVGPPKK